MDLRISAPAKVNLSLHITGKRDDGYHNLVTRMQKLDLCDQLNLRITHDDAIQLFCDTDEIPADESNLAVRAAKRYLDYCDAASGKGVRIELEKRIPVGAGLGGGSSDAAAVLNGLNALFGESLSTDQLIEIGRKLGADVPFFVSDYSSAVATGIGDMLQQVEDADHFLYLLVNPGFHVSTKWVYENYRLTKKNKKFKLCGSRNFDPDFDAGPFCADQLHNDLEQVTIAHFSMLGQIKKVLSDAGAEGALMSGSGPTVFGLFTDRDKRESARLRLEQVFNEDNFRTISVEAFTGA